MDRAALCSASKASHVMPALLQIQVPFGTPLLASHRQQQIALSVLEARYRLQSTAAFASLHALKFAHLLECF
jgi:hypothetical protein